jgi:uncharacterized membrane protein
MSSDGDGKDDARFWKYRLFYYNAEDRRVFVSKRLGFGWTLNFARPVSWVIVAAPVVVAVVATWYGGR